MYVFIRQKRKEYDITEEDLKRIETRFDISFPEKLKSYHLEHNGDLIKICNFMVDGYEYEISEIVQLKYGSCTFEDIVQGDREDKIIPENMLPIANNRGGDYYYWDAISENVFLYYCDDIENPIFICDNIEELFKILENSFNK